METVQVLASHAKCHDTIPPEFIRPERERPAITTVRSKALEVPVIDLDHSDETDLVRLVAEAGKEWGMFQVVNHGIPNEVISALQKAGKDFFALPQEEKELCAKTGEGGSIEGYGTKLQKEMDGKKGWVDHLFHFIWPPSVINYKVWPKNPPSYREASEAYAGHLRKVANKLFKCLSLGLGPEFEGHELEAAVGGDDLVYLMKINYYPPCPRPDLALGVPAHTDMSTLTILVPNEVPGLQVLKDEQWNDVKYIPNALVIHIGDQIEILSNGKYKAVFHRTTVNKDSTRMSWPVFLEPPPEFEVGPLAKLVNDQNPAKFKTKKFKDYFYCKLNKLPQ
uniref:Flavonol synthase n=1 Tax=Cyclamen purpurascens TaxID=87532 RepID=A0A286T529_9ERIC|nr:flavonol synthase [Cyclamen purpurascens]